MLDEVDRFIVRETNKLDKIVVAILTAAVLLKQEETVTPEKAVKTYGEMLIKVRDEKLGNFP